MTFGHIFMGFDCTKSRIKNAEIFISKAIVVPSRNWFGTSYVIVRPTMYKREFHFLSIYLLVTNGSAKMAYDEVDSLAGPTLTIDSTHRVIRRLIFGHTAWLVPFKLLQKSNICPLMRNS